MTGIIKVDTIQNNGGTTGLTIDSSGNLSAPGNLDVTGRITSTQVAFLARGQSPSTISSGTDQTVVYGSTDYNIGSGYSTSTGKFTAPVSGLYLFSFINMAQSSYFRSDIRINSSSQTQFRTDHDGAQNMNYMQATITVIYNLTAGDVVDHYYTDGQLGGNSNETQFMGVLIG